MSYTLFDHQKVMLELETENDRFLTTSHAPVIMAL